MDIVECDAGFNGDGKITPYLRDTGPSFLASQERLDFDRPLLRQCSSHDELTALLTRLLLTSRSSVVYLEAGHFDPSHGASLFSTCSLSIGVKMLRALFESLDYGPKFGFGILVDDLGLECSETSCGIDNGPVEESSVGTGELPRTLEAILSSEKLIRRDRVLVASERRAKNRGIRALRRSQRPSDDPHASLAIRRPHGQIVFKGRESDIVLAEVHSESVWRPKCPLIISQHYLDTAATLRKRFKGRESIALVDWSELSDREKVRGGREYFIAQCRKASLIVTCVNVFHVDSSGQEFVVESESSSVIETHSVEMPEL